MEKTLKELKFDQIIIIDDLFDHMNPYEVFMNTPLDVLAEKLAEIGNPSTVKMLERIAEYQDKDNIEKLMTKELLSALGNPSRSEVLYDAILREDFSIPVSTYKNYESYIKEEELLKEKKCLFIIDKLFENSEIQGEAILQNITSTLSESSEVYAIIYTDHNEYQADDDTLYLEENICSKKNDDIENAIMRNIFTNTSNQLKELYLGYIKNANLNSEDFVKNLSPSLMYHLTTHFSKLEGMIPAELLNRVYVDKISHNFYIAIAEEVFRLNELTKTLDIISRLSKPGKLGSSVLLETYFNSIINTNVNQLISPVAQGDIFTIDDNQYLLLNQSCNLSVRELNGSKIGRKDNLALLLELRHKDRGGFDGGQDGVLSIKEVNYVYKFSSTFYCSFPALDLCSYNYDGYSILSNDLLVAATNKSIDNVEFSDLVKLKSGIVLPNSDSIIFYRDTAVNLNTINEISKLQSPYLSEYHNLMNAIEPTVRQDGSTIYFGVKREFRLTGSEIDIITDDYHNYEARLGTINYSKEVVSQSIYNVSLPVISESQIVTHNFEKEYYDDRNKIVAAITNEYPYIIQSKLNIDMSSKTVSVNGNFDKTVSIQSDFNINSLDSNRMKIKIDEYIEKVCGVDKNDKQLILTKQTGEYWYSAEQIESGKIIVSLIKRV